MGEEECRGCDLAPCSVLRVFRCCLDLVSVGCCTSAGPFLQLAQICEPRHVLAGPGRAGALRQKSMPHPFLLFLHKSIDFMGNIRVLRGFCL